ncbi:hypothetical protein ZIOFF_024238 [Zingiber officinale]|uniref:Uncharacterized protein n=1 Tax=Zingiber officinale TaxID=94328 RepID=A0A8J5LDE5_ZINOF|nr:hypothetical protein ZIOFF_024238 [Zingiber officinale]
MAVDQCCPIRSVSPTVDQCRTTPKPSSSELLCHAKDALGLLGDFLPVWKSRNFFFSFYVLFSGVESFDVDLQEQKVTVKGNVTPEAVFQTVSRSGKKTSFWEASEADPVPEAAPDVAPGA